MEISRYQSLTAFAVLTAALAGGCGEDPDASPEFEGEVQTASQAAPLETTLGRTYNQWIGRQGGTP